MSFRIVRIAEFGLGSCSERQRAVEYYIAAGCEYAELTAKDSSMPNGTYE